jgi:uncharacterized membrane protein YqiK
LVVETAQIDQTRQVQEAEIQKNLIVELARISQEQAVQLREIDKTLTVEKTKIAKEQAVMEREIEKNLIVEMAQISQTKQVQESEIYKNLAVEQARINQELVVQLKTEDKKIQLFNKQKITELSEKEKLDAEAMKTEAKVQVQAVQRTKEAEWQRDVAIIGVEAQAQPIERLADAILSEARAKAQGESLHLEARNVAEQRVLVQEALMSLIETSPQLAEKLMKPVEKIGSIKILDMGGTGDSKGFDKSNFGRLANTLLDTGAITPMLKELFDFAEVDAQAIAKQVAEYLSGLLGTVPRSGGGQSTS